ncbi:MAG: hydrogenase maturation protease [Gammaproteobacteria bacterium]
MNATLCLGIGNRFRRDDGAGPALAAALAAHTLPGVTVRTLSGEGAGLVEAFATAPRVFVFDAVASGAAPGTVHRIDAHAGSVPRGFFAYSSHAFSLAEAIELARALDALPATLRVYGIEGSDFGAGEGLSAPVAAAVAALVDEVVAMLAGAQAHA